MAFDAREYRSRVLSQYSRGKSRQLADAVRELKQDPDCAVPSQLDLIDFYDVPANPTDPDVGEHVDAVANAIKAALTKPGGSRQALDLHQLVEAKNPGLRTAAFWTEMARRRAERAQVMLKEFAKSAAADYSGLGVVTAAELTQFARGAGIPDTVSESDLARAVHDAGVRVVGAFPVVASNPAEVQRDIVSPLNKTSARSLLTVIFLRRSMADGDLAGFTIVDGFGTSMPGYSLTLAAVSDSAQYVKQLPDSDDTVGFGQVLTALATVKSDAALADLVVAYFLEVAKGIFKNTGGKRSALNAFVSQTGIDPVDAGRILLQIVPAGAAQQRTYADVQSLIATGALKEARRLYSALVAEQAGSESDVQKKALAALEDAERRVQQLRHAAAEAQTGGDLEAAARALNEALTICSDDESLSAASRALPPAPPLRFVASLSEDARTTNLSWEPGFGSTDDVRYQVIRKVGSAPQNNMDGVAIGGPTSATRLEDHQPPIAVNVFYGVSASRGGGASPVVGSEVIALPPVTEVVVTSDPTTVTLRWTTPPEASAIEVIESSADGTTRTLPVGGQSGTTSSGLHTGNTYTYRLTALYTGAAGERMRSATQRTVGVPRGAARAVTDLTINALPASGSQPEVAAEWKSVEGYVVEVWHYAQKASWLPGSRLPMTEIRAQGSQLAGRSWGGSGVDGVQGATMQGLRHYVAITCDGDHGLVGVAKPFGSAPPVQNLRGERFGEEAVLSWDWPGDEFQVRVRWSGAESGERTIQASDYRREGGCRVRLGSRGGTVTVASVAGEGTGQWASAETTITIDGSQQTVTYDIEFQKKLWGPPSHATLTFALPSPEARADVVVIGQFSKYMPFDVTQGFELQRATVSVDSSRIAVNIPRGSGSLWVRAFTSTPGVRLEDPPTNRMKAG